MLEAPASIETIASRAVGYRGQIRLREGVAYALSALLPAVLAFVRVPLYSRWFSPQVYGGFTVVSTGSALASGVLLAVFSNALYRYYDGYRRTGELQPFLASLAAGVVVSFALVGAAILVVRHLWMEAAHAVLAWAFVLFVIGTLQGLLAQINRLEHQAGVFVAGRLIDPLWQLGFPLAFMRFGFSGEPVIFATAVLAGTSSVAVGAIWARRQVAWAKPWRASLPLLTRALHYGLPLIPLALVNWVIGSSDRYMIQWFLGSQSTGVYAIGYGLAWMPISMTSSVLVVVLAPSVWERVNARGANEGMRLVGRFARLYLGIAVPEALGLAVLGPRIVDVLLAPQYGAATQVVGPVAFAAVFGGLYPFLVKPWELHEATIQVPIYVGTGAVLSVLLNLWMIKVLGVAGPAWSALVAYGSVALLLLWAGTRRYGVSLGPTMRDTWAIGVPSGLMLAAIWGMDRWLQSQGMLTLAAIIGVGATVYLVTWLSFQSELRDWLRARRTRSSA